MSALLLPTLGFAAQEVTVNVLNDHIEPVQNPLVVLGQTGSIATAHVGDLVGTTAKSVLDQSQPIIVSLEETTFASSTGLETTVGQHFTYSMSDDSVNTNFALNYLQPSLRDYTFDYPSSSSETIGDPLGRLQAMLPGPSPISFNAEVSELVTSDIVSNYVAWKIGFHATVFEHGILVRSSEWVNLKDGVTFLVDTSGHSYALAGSPALPQIASYWMESADLSTGLSIQAVKVSADLLEFHVTGYLPPGDTLIGFVSSAGGTVYPRDEMPPVVGNDFPPAECTPPNPNCTTAGRCAPPHPGGTVVGSSFTSCKDEFLKIGGKVCAGPGSEQSEQVCSAWEGGTSIKITVPVPGATLEWSASGKVSGSICTTVTALPGHCAQSWKCIKKCCKDWEICYVPWYGIGARYKTVETCCVIQGATSSTGCPQQ